MTRGCYGCCCAIWPAKDNSQRTIYSSPRLRGKNSLIDIKSCGVYPSFSAAVMVIMTAKCGLEYWFQAIIQLQEQHFAPLESSFAAVFCFFFDRPVGTGRRSPGRRCPQSATDEVVA